MTFESDTTRAMSLVLSSESSGLQHLVLSVASFQSNVFASRINEYFVDRKAAKKKNLCVFLPQMATIWCHPFVRTADILIL